MDINRLKIENDEQAEKISEILKKYYKKDINISKIESDKQADKIFEILKNYYETKNPNIKVYINNTVYKQNAKEKEKEKYQNDTAYREKKSANEIV